MQTAGETKEKEAHPNVRSNKWGAEQEPGTAHILSQTYDPDFYIPLYTVANLDIVSHWQVALLGEPAHSYFIMCFLK